MKDVEEKKIILNDGTEVPYGLLVWSTGVGPSAIIQSLDLPKAPGGRLFLLHNIVVLFFFLKAYKQRTSSPTKHRGKRY